jgi:hypothetical protein
MRTTRLIIIFFLVFAVGAGCSVLDFITGIPINPSSMDNKWAEICESEIVSNLKINYLNVESSRGETQRVCRNKVSFRLTPKEEEKYRKNVFALFTKICKSDILINARLSTQGRSLGNATRNCSR